MTTTSNIVLGVAVWQTSTSYISGALVRNNSNAYLCITSGTSAASGGPTTTSLNITDGSAHWQYLCAVNYTSLSSWAAGIPGTPTQPIVGLVLAGSSIDITTPAFTPYLSLTGHSTTPTNTITLAPFPGFGINTIIGQGSFQQADAFTADFSTDFNGSVAAAQPGAFNSSAINFLAPVTPAGSVNYFDITDANVIFNGLQFKDQGAASNCTLIKTETGASNFLITDCIIDGYAQPSGASILDINSQGLITNSLIVDRQASANTNPTAVLNSGNASHIVNSTIVKINGETGGTTTAINWTTTTGAIFRNNAVYGYGNPFGSGVGGSATADHNVSSASTFTSSGLTVGSGNVTGTLAANQFVGATTDFRLLPSAACVNAGIADTTDIPLSNDIVGRTRLQWDAGAFALFVVAVTASAPLALKASGTAANLVVTNKASTQQAGFSSGFSNGFGASVQGFSSGFSNGFGPRIGGNYLAIITAAATVSSTNGASSTTAISVKVAGSAVQQDQASATVAITKAVAATATLNDLASATLLLPSLTPVILVSFPINASGTPAIPALVCVGALLQQYAAGALVTLSGLQALAAVAIAAQSTNASATANIDAGSLIRAGQEEQASATVSFGTMLATGSVAQFDIVSAVSISLPPMVCVAAIGTSCSALVTLSPIASTATMTQAGQAIGRASLLTITIPTPVQQKLQADPGASIFLLADGSGLILQADVQRARSLTDATSTSSTSTIPPLACVSLAFESDGATSTVNVLTMAAVSTAGQSDLAVGSASVMLAASGIAMQQRSATCLAALASLQAVVAAGQSDTATGTGSIVLAAITVAGQSNTATSAKNINVAVVATLGQSDPVSAADSVSLSCVATSILSTPVNAAVSVFALRAVVAISLSNATAVDNIIALLASGAVSSSTNASALDSLPPLVAVVVALGQGFAIGKATFATMADVAALGQSDTASATNSVLSLVSVAALSSNTNASATVSQNLTVAASGVLQDVATCSAAITLHFVGTAGQSNTAAAAVNLESMSCVGFLMDAAQGRSTFSLGCVALITQNYPQGIAFEIANIGTLTATASMSSLTTSSGVATIPTLSCIGQLGQVSSAVGAITLPPIIAAASMTSLTTAIATAVIPPLACFAFTSTTFGIGVGTIAITASASLGGNNTASGFAGVGTLAETNATLYVSPIGYETGQDVVFWSA